MTLLTWPNIIRAAALAALSLLAICDFGLGIMAKEVPREVYLGLVAVVLGVDIKALRDAIMRMLSGGTSDDKK